MPYVEILKLLLAHGAPYRHIVLKSALFGFLGEI
jgi:hypothetical protein